MIRGLTQLHAQACWKYFQNKYNTRNVNKRTWLMSQFAAKMGVKSIDRFFNNYSTILGRTIYTPFRVGGVGTSPEKQIEICCHEHQHRIQALDIGWLKYAWRYAGSKAKRANYEMDGYRVSMEVNYMMTGKLLSIESICASLRDAYLIDEEDVKNAYSNLKFSQMVIKKGGIVSQASHDFRDWARWYGLMK